MTERLLSLAGVRHRYGDGDWELAVPAFGLGTDEVVGILGPNGSGKSTLLRVAAGTLAPTAGSVILDGADLARADRRWVARRLGYLPQDTDSQFDHTVEDVVGMGRYAHLTGLGLWSAADTAAVDKALAATETIELRARRLSHLSGGERQRVFLASVLAQEPRVLLLDEPTRALDVHHRVRFFGLLRELVRTGIGVAVVTHDLNLAALFCDRLLLLDDGRPVREGPPDDVLRDDVIADVYGPEVVSGRHPVTGRRVFLPADRAEASA